MTRLEGGSERTVRAECKVQNAKCKMQNEKEARAGEKHGLLALPSVRFLFVLCSSGTIWGVSQAGEVRLETAWEETTRVYAVRAEDRWIARDKALHVGASAGIIGLVYHSYHCQLKNPEGGSRVFAVSLSAACGLGKELWDSKKVPRGLSWKDLVADGVGILLGVALFTF